MKLEQKFYSPETKSSDFLYAHSTALQQLLEARASGKPYQLFVSDLDDTLTVLRHPETYAATNAVRSLLESQAKVLCVATSRSIEWVLSEEQRLKSPNFYRLPPHLHLDPQTAIKSYGDPREHEPEGVLNAPIIISSTGTEIYVRRNDSYGGGYVRDEEYTQLMRSEPEHWRKITMQVIHALDPEASLVKLSSEETMEGYTDGTAYMAPPDYRIKAIALSDPTDTEKGLTNKLTFQTRLEFLRRNFTAYSMLREQGRLDELATFEESFRKLGINVGALTEMLPEDVNNLRFLDDSSPAKGVYRFYLLPNRGSKARAANWVISKLGKQLLVGDTTPEVNVTLAGDSSPDLELGLFSCGRGKFGIKVNSTFILAGGSRLTPILLALSRKRDFPIIFAGEDLSAWAERFEDFNEREGTVLFRSPFSDKPIKIIIGNIAFPDTKGPETLQEYLLKN